MAAKVVWFHCLCLYLALLIMTTPVTPTNLSMTPVIFISNSDLPGTSTRGRINLGIIPPFIPRSTTMKTSLPHCLADVDVQRVTQAVP